MSTKKNWRAPTIEDRLELIQQKFPEIRWRLQCLTEEEIATLDRMYKLAEAGERDPVMYEGKYYSDPSAVVRRIYFGDFDGGAAHSVQ
jgi:hypothetical protein